VSEETHFAILSWGRSGSTWLLEKARQHPHVAIVAEPFGDGAHDSAVWAHGAYWDDDEIFLNPRRGTGHFEHPGDYVAAKVWGIPVAATGLKILLDHISKFPTVADWLRDECKDMRIIWLYRNPLRCLFSYFRAKKDGRVGYRKGRFSPPPKESMELDPEFMLQSLIGMESEWEVATQLVRECPSQMRLTYSELTGDEDGHLDQIFRFLGVNPSRFECGPPKCLRHHARLPLRRIMPWPFKELVSNWEEIRDHFPDDKRHYFEEDLT
jgi:hypothetical protein